MNIVAKIIHCSIENATMMQRGTENYFKRREILFNETIPSLKDIGIESSFIDAIMHPTLVFDRSNENKSYVGSKAKIAHLNREYTVDNPHPSAFEISLCMGHMHAWEFGIVENKPVLVLEDDVIIPDETHKKVIKDSILDFLNINEPAMLYLQATNGSTPRPKIKLKTYNESKIKQVTNNLYKVDNNYPDWACSASYLVNTKACINLVNRANSIGLRASDGFIHRAVQENLMNAYIPVNYEKSILCHPTLS
jgi:GR25 family glycosyltransferase involved in LPS biosynthesis